MSELSVTTTRTANPRAPRGVWAVAFLVVAVWGAIVGGAPLLLGPPGGDDAYYHAMYAQQEAHCWRAGVLFARWYPDLNGGLGGPEPRTRPALPLVVHGVLALVFDDAVAATTVATVLIPMAAGLVMVGVARRRGASASLALLSGVAWGAAPYLLVSLHERAALQEGWAIALLPWLFDAFLPPSPRDAGEVVRASLALAVVLATQLLVAFMAGLVVAVAHVASRHRRPLELMAAAAIGSGLSAISWLPNLVSLRRIHGRLFATGWFDWRHRFLLAGGDPDPRLAHNLFLAFTGLAAAALLVAFLAAAAPRTLAVASLLTALLATSLSRPVWALVPGFALLQFPWRWLAPASCLLVLALLSLRRTSLAVAAAVIFALPGVVALGGEWRLPSGPPLRPSDTPTQAALAATRYGVPAILPSFPATIPKRVDLGEALAAASLARSSLSPADPAGPRVWGWKVDLGARDRVTVPLLADDGWRAELDRRTVAWRPSAGLVSVEVPAGPHRIRLAQVPLPEDVAGIAVTLLTGLALAVLRARGSRRAAVRMSL
ncbi:MAG: hypothetical protein ACM3O7_08200 [Acidobacteriota bacterium]